MRHIDEDTITQAVIARHAGAGDPRLREVVTSLVQHLHAFARDVKPTEAEWAEGVRFLADCGRHEVALLSDTLGLSALVTAANRRKPRGCTEASVPPTALANGVPPQRDNGEPEPCYVRGRVRALDGTPIAGADVRIGQADVLRSDADGGFVGKAIVAAPQLVAHDGPVAALLHALGRPAWRPAHLHFTISARGYERLVTQVFRRGDPYLETDAVFGVRPSLVADWVRHECGRTPGGEHSTEPFTTLDFTFVLNNDTAGDTP